MRHDALSLHAFVCCLGPLECVGGVGCFALADGGGLVRESLLVLFVVDAVVVLADESGRHVRDVLLWLAGGLGRGLACSEESLVIVSAGLGGLASSDGRPSR